jgi:hypothetical protein
MDSANSPNDTFNWWKDSAATVMTTPDTVTLSGASSPISSSDGQGFEKPRGYTGTGTEGKGQGMDLKTLEKPVPSSRVAGYPWYLVRVSHFVQIIY